MMVMVMVLRMPTGIVSAVTDDCGTTLNADDRGTALNANNRRTALATDDDAARRKRLAGKNERTARRRALCVDLERTESATGIEDLVGLQKPRTVRTMIRTCVGGVRVVESSTSRTDSVTATFRVSEVAIPGIEREKASATEEEILGFLSHDFFALPLHSDGVAELIDDTTTSWLVVTEVTVLLRMTLLLLWVTAELMLSELTEGLLAVTAEDAS